MHYKEGMYRITAPLEIVKNSVNIETVATVYWEQNELFFLTWKVSLSNTLAVFSWFKSNAVIFHLGIVSHLPLFSSASFVLKNVLLEWYFKPTVLLHPSRYFLHSTGSLFVTLLSKKLQLLSSILLNLEAPLCLKEKFSFVSANNAHMTRGAASGNLVVPQPRTKIGRASCRERV